MNKEAVRMAVLLLAGVVSAPAQTDPGLSTKPAGLTVTGERIAPEEKAADLSRPEPASLDFVTTEEEQEFLQAAEDGQTWAKARLGIIYVNTPDDPARMELGRRMLEQAAGQNSADALFELAKMALAGRGMERSPSAAFDYMQRAAELGLPEAQYELASMYSDGRGTKADSAAALQWAEKAANQSHPVAVVNVGRIKLQSPHPAAKAEGLAMLERAAEGGNKRAILALATAYARGDQGVTKDERMAGQLLKPLAEEGDAEAQFSLASLYQFGEGYTSQRDQAQLWLQRAADQGHSEAARILESGNQQTTE